MAVTVRLATADDGRALAQLRWRWPAEEPAGRDAPRSDRATFVDSFAAWTADNMATHLPFLAEVDGEPVGMAWLALAERVPAPAEPRRRTGDVQSVYVVPGRRNGGVGAGLIGAVLAEARRRGLVHVTVHSSERAVPFYVRAGFRGAGLWLEWRP